MKNTKEAATTAGVPANATPTLLDVGERLRAFMAFMQRPEIYWAIFDSNAQETTNYRGRIGGIPPVMDNVGAVVYANSDAYWATFPDATRSNAPRGMSTKIAPPEGLLAVGENRLRKAVDLLIEVREQMRDMIAYLTSPEVKKAVSKSTTPEVARYRNRGYGISNIVQRMMRLVEEGDESFHPDMYVITPGTDAEVVS